MKHLFLLTTFILIICFSYAQNKQVISGKSSVKHITVKQKTSTKTVKLFPDLSINNQVFTDENKNNIIDANETSYIKFIVENKGNGEAQDVQVKISLINSIQGLSFEPVINMGNIQPNENRNISTSVKGEMNIIDGTAEFKIEVLEKSGFDAFPVEIKIPTRKFEAPEIVVADAVFTTADGYEIELNKNVILTVLIQNQGKGDAKNVNTKFLLLNENSFLTGETDNVFFENLSSGEYKKLSFEFIATRRYAYDNIPVKVKLSESLNKYAKDTILIARLGEIPEREIITIDGKPIKETVIEKVSLVSDVDRNIPVNEIKHQNRYALIIGNEDYTS
ncbi:MAG: hypothetical protein KAT68_10265 [Bacteroidales bacterium]|nr:hypothetical protein [Bacteroidales bacterium]